MAIAYFITHPEVAIDPGVPVPQWRLSLAGSQRMIRLLRQSWVNGVSGIYCSDERKARDAAGIMADYLGLAPVVIAELGENDRSATGYLAREEFEATADRFFAHPDQNIRGWESANDAQRRIVDAARRINAQAPAEGDIAIISHGAVGALLLCHLKNVPISRSQDQPGSGGGNLFAFERATGRLLVDWQPIEAPL
jgi:broad specificity phosphatase PhoE